MSQSVDARRLKRSVIISAAIVWLFSILKAFDYVPELQAGTATLWDHVLMGAFVFGAIVSSVMVRSSNRQ